MADANLKRIVIEEWLKTIELEAKAIEADAQAAIVEQKVKAYKGIENFEKEVTKGFMEALHLGFLK